MKPKLEMMIDNERHAELLDKAYKKCTKKEPKENREIDVHPMVFTVFFMLALAVTLYTEYFEVPLPW